METTSNLQELNWFATNQKRCGHKAQSDWSLFGGTFTPNLDNTVNWWALTLSLAEKSPGNEVGPRSHERHRNFWATECQLFALKAKFWWLPWICIWHKQSFIWLSTNQMRWGHLVQFNWLLFSRTCILKLDNPINWQPPKESFLGRMLDTRAWGGAEMRAL